MGTLKLSSIISKNLPVAPMLNDIGLEMSTHASALSEAVALPSVDTDETTPAVALRSTSSPESRLTKTSTVLENALSPRVSYNEGSLRNAARLDNAMTIPSG